MPPYKVVLMSDNYYGLIKEKKYSCETDFFGWRLCNHSKINIFSPFPTKMVFIYYKFNG